MDHQKPAVIKAKNKLMKLLPRAAQAVSVSFQNPPYSPAKEKRSDQYGNHTKAHKTHIGKGFSGTLVPPEARRTSKNSSFVTHEPTSPKVSCMGTIKCKHMQNKKMVPVLSKEDKRRIAAAAASKVETTVAASPVVKEKKKSAIKSLFHHGRKSDVSYDRGCKTPSLAPEKAPGLGQMKRFASGRETFANFDWTNPTAQVAPEYYSDGERENHSDDEEEKREVIISFSAPILVNGVGNKNKNNNKCRGIELEPRKEINLWKRRTMAQPKPLVI